LKKAHGVDPTNPTQQAQRRLGFPFPSTNRFQIQQHVELGTLDLSEDVAMIIFENLLFLPLGVDFFDLPLAAAGTASTAAVEVLVGIQTHKEQAVDFTTFQRLIGL